MSFEKLNEEINMRIFKSFMNLLWHFVMLAAGTSCLYQAWTETDELLRSVKLIEGFIFFMASSIQTIHEKVKELSERQ